jgi:hypothetical protein
VLSRCLGSMIVTPRGVLCSGVLLHRYKGLMCGTCDPAYRDTSGGKAVTKRYALFMGSCVDCAMSPHVTRLVLVILFLLLFGYVGLGIYCQVNSGSNMLRNAQASNHNSLGGSDSPDPSGTTSARQPAQGTPRVAHVWRLPAQTTYIQAQNLPMQPPPQQAQPQPQPQPQPQFQQQQQQRLGPVQPMAVQMAGLVEVWKALTSYVQASLQVNVSPIVGAQCAACMLSEHCHPS